ncbi:MAG: DUF262 domain-containing protein [Succinivibrio sp.]|nr:DUF262 domain-containing protein [Succinivibrio sp.]
MSSTKSGDNCYNAPEIGNSGAFAMDEKYPQPLNTFYYGEFTLRHWLRLLLKRELELAEFQRCLAWGEGKVRKLINSLSQGQFVPQVILGLLREPDNKNKLIIIDGQQRLTSLLLAYLNLYPDKDKFQRVGDIISPDLFAERTPLSDEDPDSDTNSETLSGSVAELTDHGIAVANQPAPEETTDKKILHLKKSPVLQTVSGFETAEKNTFDGVNDYERKHPIIRWNFRHLTSQGNSREEIIHKLRETRIEGQDGYLIDCYRQLYPSCDAPSDDFFDSHTMSYTYVIPDIVSDPQRFYINMFVNVNDTPKVLRPIEVRRSLYFYDEDLKKFLEPECLEEFTFRYDRSRWTVDFCRCLALLSCYRRKNHDSAAVAECLEGGIEDFIKAFVLTLVDSRDSQKRTDNVSDGKENADIQKGFAIPLPWPEDGPTAEDFDNYSELITLHGGLQSMGKRLEQGVKEFKLPSHCKSIAEADLFFIGLVYSTVINNLRPKLGKKDELYSKLQQAVITQRKTSSNSRAPNTPDLVVERIEESIKIYGDFTE